MKKTILALALMFGIATPAFAGEAVIVPIDPQYAPDQKAVVYLEKIDDVTSLASIKGACSLAREFLSEKRKVEFVGVIGKGKDKTGYFCAVIGR